MNQPENILEEAYQLTSRVRNEAYGHPLDDYSATAMIFTAILRRAGKLKPEATITPDEAQMLMIGVKLSRLASNPTHRDSLVDIAGYARTIQMTQERRTELWARQEEARGHGA